MLSVLSTITASLVLASTTATAAQDCAQLHANIEKAQAALPRLPEQRDLLQGAIRDLQNELSALCGDTSANRVAPSRPVITFRFNEDGEPWRNMTVTGEPQVVAGNPRQGQRSVTVRVTSANGWFVRLVTHRDEGKGAPVGGCTDMSGASEVTETVQSGHAVTAFATRDHDFRCELH